MPTFGLIAEGPTDFAVLENILVGFFNDPDMSEYIRHLQPLRDATDEQYGPGGWTRVVEYCKSSVFQEAFEQNDYLLIQIDTDCLHEKPFELDVKQAVEPLVNAVIEKFRVLIKEAFEADFYDKYAEKMLFAVAVDEIECWLLPLYFLDYKAAATNNCLHKLNMQLGKNREKIIKEKEPRHYDKLSRPFIKNKILTASSSRNPSFHIFLEALRHSFA